MAAMVPAAAIFAGAWAAAGLHSVLVVDGLRGFAAVAASGLGPVVTVAILVPLLSAVEVLVAPGRGRALALGVAAAVGAAAGTAVAVGLLVDVLRVWRAPPWSNASLFWANLGAGAVLCVGAALAYDGFVQGRQRAAALRRLRLAAAGVERQTTAARLLAAQARVDPAFLFDTMADVARRYASDRSAGDRLLDRLIAYLRAVLPELRDGASTVGRELDLARAWLDLRHERGESRPSYEFDVAEALRRLPFPPMTITPLLEAVLAGAPAAAAVTVRVDRGTAHTSLRVECSAEGARFAAAEADFGARACRRLRELHGDAARLSLSVDATRGRVAVLEIPDEDTERDHR